MICPFCLTICSRRPTLFALSRQHHRSRSRPCLAVSPNRRPVQIQGENNWFFEWTTSKTWPSYLIMKNQFSWRVTRGILPRRIHRLRFVLGKPQYEQTVELVIKHTHTPSHAHVHWFSLGLSIISKVAWVVPLGCNNTRHSSPPNWSWTFVFVTVWASFTTSLNSSERWWSTPCDSHELRKLQNRMFFDRFREQGCCALFAAFCGTETVEVGICTSIVHHHLATGPSVCNPSARPSTGSATLPRDRLTSSAWPPGKVHPNLLLGQLHPEERTQVQPTCEPLSPLLKIPATSSATPPDSSLASRNRAP